MEFGTIEIELKGLTPLLMNNIEGADLESKSRLKSKKYDKKEEAKKSAYLMKTKGKDELYVPSRCVYAMIINAGSFLTIGRKSASTIIGGAFRIEPEKIGLGTGKYEMDVRSVVIQRSRVLKARAMLQNWTLSFRIVYNKDYINPDTLKEIITQGGIKVGLLDYRPQKKGQYGTFEISKFVVK